MNIQKSRFTIHGFARLQERTAFEDVDVDGLISGGFAVNIGIELGTQKVHWLLWSEADNECFVVIRDEVTKEILTVLTLEYHNNIAWPVIKDFVARAERIATERSKPSLAEADLSSLKIHHPEARLLCDFVFRPVSGQMTLTRRIEPLLRDVTNFGRLWEDHYILDQFRRKAAKFVGGVVLEQLFVRLNKTGDAFKSYSPGITIEVPPRQVTSSVLTLATT